MRPIPECLKNIPAEYIEIILWWINISYESDLIRHIEEVTESSSIRK